MMAYSREFVDTRTGDVVTTFNLAHIQHMVPVDRLMVPLEDFQAECRGEA